MKTSKDTIQSLIRTRKQKAHDELRLYLEIGALPLMKELKLSGKQQELVEEAMKDEMLIGDMILSKARSNKGLTIRYYTDNLSKQRRESPCRPANK